MSHSGGGGAPRGGGSHERTAHSAPTAPPLAGRPVLPGAHGQGLTHSMPPTGSGPALPVPNAPGAGPETGIIDPAKSSRGRIRSLIITGLAVLGFSLCAISLANTFNAEFGILVLLFAFLLALIPLVVVIPTFIWLDRFEHEPNRLLFGAFLWGALVAALGALTVNTAFATSLARTMGSDAAEAITAIFAAPVVEELLKGAFVVLVLVLMRREFDGVIDGMVYAGITAAGFAFTENILYLSNSYYLDQSTGAYLSSTFVVRCLMSPFAHPMFTVLFGIGIGAASTTRNKTVRYLAPVAGFFAAVLAHGLWNFGAYAAGGSFFTLYLFVDVPVFLGFVALVLWARRREGRIIGQYLVPYAAAGWFSRSEVAMLSSMGQRRQSRVWARSTAGRRGLTAMREFQDAASELALLRRRMYRGDIGQHALDEERDLLDSVDARRKEFLALPTADPELAARAI